MLLLLAGLVALLPAVNRPAEAQAAQTLDMKILVISADGQETDFPHITSTLERIGIPYDTLIGTETTLTSQMLSPADNHGNYYGIVLTTGNLIYWDGSSYPSAFTPDEWETLRAYQANFGVRSVTSFTYPEAAYGLAYAGYQDTLHSPLQGTYTAAGDAAFPHVKPNGQLPFTGAWMYFGSVIDPNVTTPLVTVSVDGATYPVVSVTTFPDGRENLAITVANNPYLVHSLTLSYGWVNWVTRGIFLGEQRANIDVQIDDLFIADGVWDIEADTTGPATYRNTAQDIAALVAWQSGRRADPTTPGLTLEWAFNGSGSVAGAYPDDTLTPAIAANRNSFRFINHTYTHLNLDCGDCSDGPGVITTTAAQIKEEITRNRARGRQLELPGDIDTMVQPDISGINTPYNPMAQQAAADAGIRYWIGDTSRPGQTNPSFNTGFYAPGDSRLYIVPRYPTNLFVAVSTPDEWVDVYNHFYAPGGILCGMTTCFSEPQTYAQILEHESNYLLRYLLEGSTNPIMMHINNVRAYDGSHSVLTDLLDRTFERYAQLVDVPIRSLSFKQAGLLQKARGLYDASGVTATITPCASITISTTNAATIPVTGIAPEGVTVGHDAGQPVASVELGAGQTATYPLPGC